MHLSWVGELDMNDERYPYFHSSICQNKHNPTNYNSRKAIKSFIYLLSALGLVLNLPATAEAADLSMDSAKYPNIEAPMYAGITPKDTASDTPSFLGIPLKDPLPDKLSFAGITLWGTYDVGVIAQTASTPLSGIYWGVNVLPVTASVTKKSLVSVAPGFEAVSSVGAKIDEDLGNGWHAVGALDTGFNPLTGEIADACRSLIEANGKPATSSTWGDGSRCGQAFNGNAYGGISNPTYGTLTFGRQNPLAAALWDYDPLDGAAISLIGWLPSMAGGQGISEAGRWDNSIKYKVNLGPAHAGVMYTEGAQGTAIHGFGIGGNIGATWKGFSIDGVYQHETDGIINPSAFGVGACGTATTPSCDTLHSTGVNTSGLEILSKYDYELGSSYYAGGPHDKLTFYLGYEQVKYMDPTNPIQVGDTTVNGYVVGSINNTAYLYGQRIREIGWTGMKYRTGPWTLDLGYYHMHVPYYATSATSKKCSNSSASNCTADTDVISGLADYAVTKHLDLYSGLAWNGYSGGLAAGAEVTQATTFISGLKISF
jgi:predicted porin